MYIAAAAPGGMPWAPWPLAAAAAAATMALLSWPPPPLPGGIAGRAM